MNINPCLSQKNLDYLCDYELERRGKGSAAWNCTHRHTVLLVEEGLLPILGRKTVLQDVSLRNPEMGGGLC